MYLSSYLSGRLACGTSSMLPDLRHSISSVEAGNTSHIMSSSVFSVSSLFSSTSLSNLQRSAQLISSLRSLTVQDLLAYPHIVWHRDLFRSKAIKNAMETIDRLAAEGRIQVVGDWPQTKVRIIPPVNDFKDQILTIDDYYRFSLAHMINLREKTAVKLRLTLTLPLDKMLTDPTGRCIRIINLVRRPDITPEILRDFDRIRSNRREIAPNLPNPIIEWEIASRSVDIQLVLATPDLPWNLSGLSCNGGLTAEIVQLIVKDPKTVNWTRLQGEWKEPLVCTTIPLSEQVLSSGIFNVRTYRWYRSYLSLNSNINLRLIEFVDDNQLGFGPWDWYALSRRVPIDDILSTLDMVCYAPGTTSASLGWHRKHLLMRSPSDIEVIFKALHIHNIDRNDRLPMFATPIQDQPIFGTPVQDQEERSDQSPISGDQFAVRRRTPESQKVEQMRAMYSYLRPILLSHYYDIYWTYPGGFVDLVTHNRIIKIDELRYLFPYADQIVLGLARIGIDRLNASCKWGDIDLILRS
jgi:hypothetical protein